MVSSKSGVLEGFVISDAHYKDKDSLITLLTKEGKKDILVNGGEDPKSRNHEAVLVFNKIALEVSENPISGYLAAKSTSTLGNFTSLYEDMKKSVSAQFAIEILKSFFQDDDEMPYAYFEGLMNGLKNGFDPLTLDFIFLVQSLGPMGIGLEFEECVSCGKKTGLVAFSVEDGGFICADCAKEGDIPKEADPNYLKVMRYGKMVSPEMMEHAVLPKEPCFRAFNDLAVYLGDSMGSLKTIDMLKASLR